MKKELPPVLSLEKARLPADANAGLDAVTWDFTLAPGAWAWIATGTTSRWKELGDMLCGLATPETGAVRFLEQDWARIWPDTAARARAKIGRVFADKGWLSNLDCDENIYLPHRYHGVLSKAELMAAAEQWGRRFGLWPLPVTRPAMTRISELRRCEWVRAFIGSPALVVLEDPLEGIGKSFEPALQEACREVCARGGAVVWMQEEEAACMAREPGGKVLAPLA